MNQLRQPGPNFPQWSNNLPNNIRNNFQDTNNQFYRVPQPYLAPRGNDFVRFHFQQPLLPLPLQQAPPVYNNPVPWTRSQANIVTHAPYPMSQQRIEEFNFGRENFCPPGGSPLIIQNHPGNFQPVFFGPSVQTRFLVPFIPGNQTRPPLLPLPSNFVRGNVSSRQTSPVPVYNMCQQVDNNNNAPQVNPPNGFSPHKTNFFHNGADVGFKPDEIDGIERKTFQTPNGTVRLRENKCQQRLLAFPQLPSAAHDLLNYMDEDAEILAYFEAEIQLYFNYAIMLETGVHVVLTKPSELSLTWILAFVRYVFNKSDGNLLQYNRAINRFIRLTMVNSCTLSLESDEHLGEYAILKFRNTQESQRFQGLFHMHKSELIRDEKRVYNNWQKPSESVDSSNSNLAPSENATNNKPIAWITKLPSEIAQFHGSSVEKSPVPKIIRSSDEFIYDSSTFYNALDMNSSDQLINDNKEGSRDDSLEFSFFDSTGETIKDCDSKRGDDIVFMARNVCLLMKSDRAPNDYRSPGFGTLIIVSNSDYYNYLEFKDSSNILKCRHYIDNQNRVERNYFSGDDDCCTWEAFAELYNTGPNTRCGVMNFKIVLPTVDMACRFEKVMSDSIKKTIGKGPAETWEKIETFYDTEDRDVEDLKMPLLDEFQIKLDTVAAEASLVFLSDDSKSKPNINGHPSQTTIYDYPSPARKAGKENHDKSFNISPSTKVIRIKTSKKFMEAFNEKLELNQSFKVLEFKRKALVNIFLWDFLSIVWGHCFYMIAEQEEILDTDPRFRDIEDLLRGKLLHRYTPRFNYKDKNSNTSQDTNIVASYDEPIMCTVKDCPNRVNISENVLKKIGNIPTKIRNNFCREIRCSGLGDVWFGRQMVKAKLKESTSSNDELKNPIVEEENVTKRILSSIRVDSENFMQFSFTVVMDMKSEMPALYIVFKDEHPNLSPNFDHASEYISSNFGKIINSYLLFRLEKWLECSVSQNEFLDPVFTKF